MSLKYIAIIAAVGIASAGTALYLAKQEPVAALINSGTAACKVNVNKIVELDDQHVEAGPVRFVGERVYLGHGTEITMFDRRGRFLGVIGREGSGPGEFKNIREIIELDSARIGVLEANPPRLTVLSLDGKLVSTSNLSVRLRYRGQAALAGEDLVIAGDMPARELFGKPIALMPLSGEDPTFFGDDEMETSEPQLGRVMPRMIAYHPRHGVAAVKMFKYDIESWSVTGKLRDRFTRNTGWPMWPPDLKASTADAPSSLVPEEMIAGVQFDTGGRLWVIAKTTDPRWQSVRDGGHITDWSKWTNTQIEVIDLSTKTALCSAEFDENVLLGFAGPGVISSYRESPSGAPVITLWKMSAQAN